MNEAEQRISNQCKGCNHEEEFGEKWEHHTCGKTYAKPNQDNDTELERILQEITFLEHTNCDDSCMDKYRENKKLDEALAQIKAHYINKADIEEALKELTPGAYEPAELRHKLGLE